MRLYSQQAHVRNAIRDGNVNDRIDEDENTLLHIIEEPRLVQLLIENGADVNARNKIRETPLHLKINPESVKLLIEAGAKVNAKNLDWETPLFYNCIEDPSRDVETRIKNIKFLLENGANKNVGNFTEGNTPLYFVLTPRIIRLLLENGANIEHRNHKLLRPIDVNYESDYNDEAFQEQRVRNINLVLQEMEQEKLKELERKRKKTDGIIRLLKNKQRIKQPNKKNDAGQTYLHIYREYPEVVKFLIQNGADPFSKNNRGMIPFHQTANQQSRQILFKSMSESLKPKIERLKTLLSDQPEHVIHQYQQQIRDKDLLCPISNQIMSCPVRNQVKNLYDKEYIQQWQKRNKHPVFQQVRDPLTNVLYKPTKLALDVEKLIELKQLVDRKLREIQKQQAVQQTKMSQI